VRILHLDRHIGKSIEQYRSVNVSFSRVIPTTTQAHIGCIHFSHGGIVGLHQAITQQLFLVVAGSGWVRGESDERTPVSAGQAAFWEKGEWHESGSESGMTAIVIEGDDINPLWPAAD
jgi:quercetin dioxygenase-like cupin family protein